MTHAQGAGGPPEGDAAEARRAEAQALRAQGDLRGACEVLSQLIDDAPACAAAFNDRGCVRVDLGEVDEALRDLAEAVRLDPDFEEARRNFGIVANLAPGLGGPAGAASTVSAVLAQAPRSGSFAAALLDFLRGAVAVPAGHEDRREDAIQDVVVRVLGLSRSEDLPLAEALRRLRRSSTRAWVRSLLGVSRRQEVGRLEGDLPAKEEGGAGASSLRLEDHLAQLKAQVLAGSQPATRWRRRIVWDVFVGALLEGVRLTRAEVIEALRALEVPPKRATDGQILADLDLIAAALRDARPT
jgi:hypothetical protein